MSRELDLPQTGKGGNIVNVLIEQPLVPVRGDKGVVIQVRVGGADAVNLLSLAGAETFARVETPQALEQCLPPQHLMQAGDAAGELIGRVKEGRVAIGNFIRAPEKLGGNRPAAFGTPL